MESALNSVGKTEIHSQVKMISTSATDIEMQSTLLNNGR